MFEPPVQIRVSEVGEFIRFRSCERRFKLGLNNRALARSVPFSERLFNSLDPVLQQVGREAEDAWARALVGRGVRPLDAPAEAEGGPGVSWDGFRASVAGLAPGQAAFAREVGLGGRIGAFDLSGRADFVVVLWSGGTPLLRVVEGKASRKDRTYHRIQLAAYLALIRQRLAAEPLLIAGQRVDADAVEGVVVRIDEATNEPQDMVARPALNLDTEAADLFRMLADDGALIAIARAELDALDFQLDPKCDGCIFNVHCFPESARQRRLELVGIAPTTSRALREAGVPDIDALATLDPASPAGVAIRQAAGFDGDLGQLVALAAARRATLPREADERAGYVVGSLPHAGHGQLPPHEIDGRRLVRIYMEVDYDYTENRVGALAAHVTASGWQLRTPFGDDRRPLASIVEVEDASVRGDASTLSRPVSGRDVFAFQTQPWSGIGDQDTGAERQMIQQFLFEVVEGIAEVASAPAAPIHFYVYSRSEMTQLVEACTRAGSSLLTSLRQLLGSRESLEQLIFSCVQDEVDDRFALGWTSRGLCVATSLTWFGQVYHWKRMVTGGAVDLDRVFEQDVFDFRTALELDAQGNWAKSAADTITRHRFEIRSRFHDTLTAPYWRALWGSLPDDPNADPRTRAAIERYRRAQAPGLLRAYLVARAHALRWLDERVRFKNAEIEKPVLNIAGLRDFTLGVDTTARAAIDFLRLDHHVGMTDWLTGHIRPPAARVQAGRTIPLRDARSTATRTVVAAFDVAAFGLAPAEVSMRTSFDVGSFVRLSPRASDPDRGQSMRQLLAGGMTCTVRAVDWETGTIELSPMFSAGTDYVLRSWMPDASADVFLHASLDESPSDFVAGNVEGRLRTGRGRHVFDWFEPSRPAIPAISPVPPARLLRIAALLSAWRVPHPVLQAPLTRDQAEAVLDGLGTRVQLLKGPPGTGKTVTTAASILARTAARLGQGGVVLVAAHTHLAVNTLMRRLDRYLPSFRAEAASQSLDMPSVTLARVHSGAIEVTGGGIADFSATSCATLVKKWRAAGVVVVGGTTNAILKMARELSSKVPYRDLREGFTADVLVVDEASMMVFPHFLSLATMVHTDGEVMLAGDNRQLAPIVSHDWENEDRPPAQHYQPFKSAYEAVLRIIAESRPLAAECRQSALTYTFRLPPIIRELISRIYGDLDDIALEGPERPQALPSEAPAGDWPDVWRDDERLVLVVHSERGSRQSNVLEADIVRAIIDAREDHGVDTIAVITPHRAQRALLKARLLPHAHAASIIDTVEKVQGGERPTIVVSGTESDPHAIGAAASFILNLNRANVAFSRTQEKLVVVCAETLLDHVPTEVEDYESALLWKSLRNLCRRTLFTIEFGGFRVRALGPLLRT